MYRVFYTILLTMEFHQHRIASTSYLISPANEKLVICSVLILENYP
jgi:hypothetical protein